MLWWDVQTIFMDCGRLDEQKKVNVVVMKQGWIAKTKKNVYMEYGCRGRMIFHMRDIKRKKINIKELCLIIKLEMRLEID